MTDQEWVPDEALKTMPMHKALHGEDPIKVANELLKEALPMSIMSITHLAIHSPAEQVRLQAAKYVVDRTLGPVKDDMRVADNKPAWEKIYEGVLVEAESIINGNS